MASLTRVFSWLFDLKLCKICLLHGRFRLSVVTGSSKGSTGKLFSSQLKLLVNSGKKIQLLNNTKLLQSPRFYSSLVASVPQKKTIKDESTQERGEFSEVLPKVVKSIKQTDPRRELFAVVHMCGSQYKVTTNDIIMVTKIPAECGDKLRLDKVLLVGGKDFSLIGRPLLSTSLATVEALVVEKSKGEKIIIFKKIKRKNFKRWKGYRRELTVLRITKIDVNPSELDKEEPNVLS